MPIQKLQQICGSANVLTQQEDLIPYAFDGTAAMRQMPRCVVFPETSKQISQILTVALQSKIPVVTRGSGTGLSGGSIPLPGAIILCMVKFDKVLDFDTKNLAMLAESGVLTQQIDEMASKHGLFYPPDPGSMKISTIGGNVAENSGGLRGLKYGVTRDYVMGMEVVLANGDICWLGSKCVKDVAGYSLKDLFVGSEGTLGVITKVLLKLVPKPTARKTLLATYNALENAAETVSAIIANKIIPCTLEFLDQKTLRCVEDFAHVGLPTSAQALLLMETDGHPAVVEEEAIRMAEIARANKALDVTVARDAAEGIRLATARRSAFSALARIKPTTILEDVTVPRSELAKMVRAVETIASECGLDIAIFGHMGDGNLHPTILTDERDASQMQRVDEALGKMVDAAVKLGGTITGEHGVGLAKKKYLPVQFDPGSMQLLRQIKQTLDPGVILNPGKIFD